MKKMLIIVMALLISACATSYKTDGFTGGYSETRLDENVFTVSFKGNARTSKERAADFTLMRSAELTLENGYNYFVIIDRQSYTKISTHVSPVTSNTTTTANTTGSAYGSGNYVSGNATTTANSTTTTSGGNVTTYEKPRETNTIVCYKEKPENVFSYNAQFIYNEIARKYDIELNK